MGNSIQTLYTRLKSFGVDVFFPRQHKGDCISPYCVLLVQDRSRFEGFSSNIRYIDVLCYTPKDSYAKVLDYQNEIEGYISKIQDELMIRSTGTTTTPFFDTAVNGWMTSMLYALYERRNN